jgi:hypothetical protein
MIALPSALALPWDCSNDDMCGMYVNLDVSYSQLQLAALVCGEKKIHYHQCTGGGLRKGGVCTA